MNITSRSNNKILSFFFFCFLIFKMFIKIMAERKEVPTSEAIFVEDEV